MSYYVYLTECADGSLYCGYTTDPKKRVEKHNTGKGAKYTKGRSPVKLVYVEKQETKSEAIKREYEIKQLSRKKKKELINTKIKT